MAAKPKQIGEREEVINGQRVKVRIFAPFVPEPPPAEPMGARDDSNKTWNRHYRRERERMREAD
jgi:hypothetical protein